jgi:hypothetical protein
LRRENPGLGRENPLLKALGMGVKLENMETARPKADVSMLIGGHRRKDGGGERGNGAGLKAIWTF